MSYTFYEPLSAMDAMFLEIEDASLHMHIGGVTLFEAAALRGESGGLDVERILAFVQAQLHKSPRLRQKLATIPSFGRPVWVDDARFNLLYHFRHTALPEPGDERQLKRLAGRILSQQLDRGKPL
jgi:diacylglycerol O-acyltransferase